MKKRFFALLLCLLTLLTFTACTSFEKEEEGTSPAETASAKPDAPTPLSNVRPISIITGRGELSPVFSDSYKTLVEASYPIMHLYYGDEENFSELSAALDKRVADARENQVDFIETNKEDALQRDADNPEYFGGFSSENEVLVKRADSLVTSLLFSGYSFTGGAHGNYYLHGESYDSKTGKELTISDVVKDTDALAPAISEQLDIFWSDVEFFEDFEETLQNSEELSWTIDYNGITFYFSPYTLAPYAAGTQTVTLSNEEYPDILKDEYKNAPASYGLQLSTDIPFYYDVTGDGKIDEITFYHSEVFGTSESLFTICVNDVPYTEEYQFFNCEAHFVHTKDGKNYIYIEVSIENDYRYFMCYSISDTVEKLDEVKGGLRQVFHENEECHVMKDVLTNPDSFYLQRITQHLSTASGHRKYSIDKNGIPVPSDPMYVFYEEGCIELTLLQDLEADIYDEGNNTVNGKKTLKEGDKVMYCATDCEEYALLRTADGTMVRVESAHDGDSYRFIVNGIKLEELFDGLFFAG